jgi:hypothetical protein
VTITDRPASLGGIIGPLRAARRATARRNAIDSPASLAAAMLIGAGYAGARTTERATKARLPGSLLPRLASTNGRLPNSMVHPAR